MDLGALAEDLVGDTGRLAVSQWLAELDADPAGSIVSKHLREENNLPLSSQGRGAVQRFVSAAVKRGAGDAVGWYLQALNDRALDLVLQGSQTDPALPDDLCRLVNGWTVHERLGGSDKPSILPKAVAKPVDYGRLENWLRDSVCSTAYKNALGPGKEVSAGIPSVFSIFEEDRLSKFPDGTPANECRKTLGLDPLDPPEPRALLRYSKDRVGPAKVPAAFDAGTHAHFLPPAAGAGWGTTKNLNSPGEAGGVREVVVKPFSVSLLEEPIYVGA